MKSCFLILSLSFFALNFLGCTDTSQLAATINGKPIYLEEIDKAYGGKVAQQIYSLRKNILDTLIEEKLMEQVASEKNMSIDDLLKEEIEAKISEPSDSEVKAIYEASKDRFGDSYENVRGEIINALKRNRASVQENLFLSGLRKNAQIDIRLAKPPVQRVSVSVDDDPSVGPKNAKVTVIEFSDYQCPFCFRSRSTVNQLLQAYPGDLRYVFRDFPLSFHQDAFKAHVAAQCANEQEKFWEYNKRLFENQNALKEADLKSHAETLGLGMAQFNACLDSNKYASEVQKDMNEGQKAGVSGTPAFFINGILLSGAQPFEKFKEVIDEELQK